MHTFIKKIAEIIPVGETILESIVDETKIEHIFDRKGMTCGHYRDVTIKLRIGYVPKADLIKNPLVPKPKVSNPRCPCCGSFDCGCPV